MRLEPVFQVLESLGIQYALIGAHAMAARGYPRFTVDIDFLTTDARVLDRSVWTALERIGGTVNASRGDQDDPLRGVVHIDLGDLDVDIIVGRWAWEAKVVERAERMRIGDQDIPVARTSDLILLKLAAGGFADLHDAAALLALSDRDALVRDVEASIQDVRPDIRSRWRDLLADGT